MPSIGDSVRQLAAAQKSSRGVSFYSRLINRPLGRVLAAVAHAIGMTPNQVTALSAAVTGIGMVILVVFPVRELAGPLGAFALVIGFALDSADGQLARLRGTSSALGEWLDHVVDAGKMVAIHAAVLLSVVVHQTAPSAWPLFPLAFQIVAIVIYAGGTLLPLIQKSSGVTPAAGKPSSARALILLPADYGVLCLALVFISVPGVFVWLYPLLLAANALIMILLLVRWYGVLSRSS